MLYFQIWMVDLLLLIKWIKVMPPKIIVYPWVATNSWRSLKLWVEVLESLWWSVPWVTNYVECQRLQYHLSQCQVFSHGNQWLRLVINKWVGVMHLHCWQGGVIFLWLCTVVTSILSGTKLWLVVNGLKGINGQH